MKRNRNSTARPPCKTIGWKYTSQKDLGQRTGKKIKVNKIFLQIRQYIMSTLSGKTAGSTTNRKDENAFDDPTLPTLDFTLLPVVNG